MTAPREPATLTPEEARERLATVISHTYGSDPESVTVIYAILATVDALAALVDWPALLAAGERAGKVERLEFSEGQPWPTWPLSESAWRITGS